MKTRIIARDKKQNQVTVKFEHAGEVVVRPVNIVLDAGEYDKEKTAARIKEVAHGIEKKIALGVRF